MLTCRSVVAELDERLGVLGDVREHEERAGQRDAANHHRLPVAVKYHEQRAHYGWKTTDTRLLSMLISLSLFPKTPVFKRYVFEL